MSLCTDHLSYQRIAPTARKFVPTQPYLEQSSSSFNWSNKIPTSCTTYRLGECGAGVVDAEAALEAVRELK